jgi:hypothetical protein
MAPQAECDASVQVAARQQAAVMTRFLARNQAVVCACQGWNKQSPWPARYVDVALCCSSTWVSQVLSFLIRLLL